MLRFFDDAHSSTPFTVCRSVVDLILLCGRALCRVVTARHHQALDLRQQGTEFGKALSCTIQGYLDSLLADEDVMTLIGKSW
jgi:hypothetical protein